MLKVKNLSKLLQHCIPFTCSKKHNNYIVLYFSKKKHNQLSYNNSKVKNQETDLKKQIFFEVSKYSIDQWTGHKIIINSYRSKQVKNQSVNWI